MLETLKNAFDKVSEFFDTIIDFISSIVGGFINLFKTLPLVKDFATSSISSLPSFLLAFATITVVISIVYLILGRQTGGGD